MHLFTTNCVVRRKYANMDVGFVLERMYNMVWVYFWQSLIYLSEEYEIIGYQKYSKWSLYMINDEYCFYIFIITYQNG